MTQAQRRDANLPKDTEQANGRGSKGLVSCLLAWVPIHWRILSSSVGSLEAVSIRMGFNEVRLWFTGLEQGASHTGEMDMSTADKWGTEAGVAGRVRGDPIHLSSKWESLC